MKMTGTTMNKILKNAGIWMFLSVFLVSMNFGTLLMAKESIPTNVTSLALNQRTFTLTALETNDVVEKSNVEPVVQTISVLNKLKNQLAQWIGQLLSQISATAPLVDENGANDAVVAVVESAVKKSAVKEPAAEESAAEEPAAEESAAEESAAEESAVEEPAVEEPAVEEPAVEEPAVEESAVEESTVEESTVEESADGEDEADAEGKPVEPFVFYYDFEEGSGGWEGISNNGTGTLTSVRSTATKQEGESSLKVTAVGDTSYTLYGPDVASLKPGDLIEFWLYRPNDGPYKLTFFSIDASGVKDAGTPICLPNAGEGEPYSQWVKLSYRMNVDAAGPFTSYGVAIATYSAASASFWLDEIKSVTNPEVKTIPSIPGFKKGISLDGGVLEADRYRDVVIKEPLTTRYQMYLKLIKVAGFDHIRLPMYPFKHTTSDAPYTIDPDYLEGMDIAIDEAIKTGLKVVLDMHGYAYTGTKNANGAAAIDENKMIALWQQLAPRYSEYADDDLYFEVMSEPLPLVWTTLNTVTLSVIAEIRKTNPTRPLIVPTLYWNSIRMLNWVKLPEEDRNIIVSLHFYEPSAFTSQGLSNTTSGIAWKGTDKEKYAIADVFDRAAQWAVANDRTLWVGEFGSYQVGALADRIRWTTFVREVMEERGIPWSYWEFESGFGVFTPWKGLYNMELLKALMPEMPEISGPGFTEAIKPSWG
jgi:endoglucanase